MRAQRAGILQGMDKLTNDEGIICAVLETQGVAIDNPLRLDNAGSNQAVQPNRRRHQQHQQFIHPRLALTIPVLPVILNALSWTRPVPDRKTPDRIQNPARTRATPSGQRSVRRVKSRRAVTNTHNVSTPDAMRSWRP